MMETDSSTKDTKSVKTGMKKILFTGAHSTPAFAVIDELLEDKQNFSLLWVGEKFNQRGNKEPSAEYKTVTEFYKLPFIEITAGKLHRKWSMQTLAINLKDLFRLIVGFIQAFFIILKYKPDIVMSFGGFLAVPIVIWAKIFGKKVATHEQTVVTGLANRIIAKFADKIFVSFKTSLEFFPKTKTVFTGNPIREDLFQINSNITASFDPELPTVYITGGNQGANEINKRIFEIVPDLLARSNVIHQTGNSTITNDYSTAISIKNSLAEDKRDRYIVRDYVFKDEIGEVFDKADIVISRAGINTITELATFGKLSILIPIPWTYLDEQTKNAKMLEETGLSKRLIQSESLTSGLLLDTIIDAIDSYNQDRGFNGEEIDSVKVKAASLVKKDAKLNIVKELKKLSR